MNTSPSSYSREEFEELQTVFEALYAESLKVTERNMQLKENIKKVTLEKMPLAHRVARMDNKLASLQKKRVINTRLGEDLGRQKM